MQLMLLPDFCSSCSTDRAGNSFASRTWQKSSGDTGIPGYLHIGKRQGQRNSSYLRSFTKGGQEFNSLYRAGENTLQKKCVQEGKGWAEGSTAEAPHKLTAKRDRALESRTLQSPLSSPEHHQSLMHYREHAGRQWSPAAQEEPCPLLFLSLWVHAMHKIWI